MLIAQEILGYFLIGLIGMLVLGVCYLPVYFILRKRVPLSRQIPCFLFGVCVLVISTATFLLDIVSKLLGGQTLLAEYHSLNLVPFQFVTESWEMGWRKQLTQTLANVLMFTPLGFIYPLAFKKKQNFKRTVVSMMLFSFLIEFIQYFIGRSADVDDIILNTVGGMLGYGIYAIARKLFKKYNAD